MGADRPVTVVVDALAVVRLTRLVTRDRITRPLRRRLIVDLYDRVGLLPPDGWEELGPTVVTDDPDAPELAYLASCDWCASMWVAVAVVALRAFTPGLWDPIARALAASQTAGMLAAY